MFFKCKHPAHRLHVKKGYTIEKHDQYPEDFNTITYHLQCSRCNKEVSIKYASMIGGVEGFMKKGKP